MARWRKHFDVTIPQTHANEAFVVSNDDVHVGGRWVLWVGPPDHIARFFVGIHGR